MTLNKMILGVALAASLSGFSPVADAAPVAAVSLSATYGQVMQDVTRVVVARRAAVRRPVARGRVVR